MIHGPGDVRVEQRADPTNSHPTDAVIRLTATCVCGSDLWDYRGVNPVTEPTSIRLRTPRVRRRRIIAMSRHETRQRLARAEGYQAMDQRRAIKTLLRP